MTRLFVFGAAAALAGCTGGGYEDVVGPFDGDTRTLAIASFEWATDGDGARAIADDLDGDGSVDNFLGEAIAAIASYGDVQVAPHGGGSVITLQATNFVDTDRAGATYFGAPGDDATVVGGRLAGGVFAPNPTRETRVPGSATLRLPIFSGAEPSVVTMRGVEIAIDADSATAIVRGGIDAAEAHRAIVIGLSQMLAAEPGMHPNIVSACDHDGDGTATDAELDACPIVHTFSTADIALFEDGRYHPHVVQSDAADSVSLAFQVHVSQQ